eukprot:TRINITY_DN3807_c0_g2_i4.p1 TRINITY_DN3807_c0_g2~~TRINITY_DN3807_c0_g2_i4.p1  ORF type:complete len:254 (+),score=98.33 TRINITY_DN3807_c0_g2_i4:169-930(+)
MLTGTEFLGHTGHRLAPAEEAALACTLKLLADEYKTPIQFWGKVLGMHGDYLVVTGYRDDVLAEPLALFSVDGGAKWHLLNAVGAKERAMCKAVRGDFQGDPSYGYQVGEVVVREAVRLAAFVLECGQSCAVVPRGALKMTEEGKVVPNAAFCGIDPPRAGKLTSYFHAVADTPKGEGPGEDSAAASVDCMPSIHTDIPKGTWRVTFDDALGTIFGSSLRFPGAVWYHRPGTPIHGYYYFGYGQENTDLPFML